MITRYTTTSVSRPLQSTADASGHSRGKALALAALGCVFLGMLVCGLLALCVEAVVSIASFKVLGAALGVFFFPLVFVLRALRMSGTETPGVVLNRQSSVELFRLLDRVCVRLRAPAIHSVRVSPDCNAVIAKAWRLAPLGSRRVRLGVGLTLMKSLTVDQFEAVMAHEIAHVLRMHTLLNALVSRLRLTLERLCVPLSRAPRCVPDPLRALVRSYLEALQRAYFPASRAGELEADEVSVRVTSARTAAQALTMSSVLKSYLVEKYWPDILARAKDSPQPLGSPFTDFDVTALAGLPAELQQWQALALAAGTSVVDTHPSFQERLASIGAPAQFAPPTPGQSADRLLGDALSEVAGALDVDWRKRIESVWETIYQNAQKQRRQLQELRSAALVSPLDEQRSLLHANLEECVGAGAAEARKMRVTLRERFPQSLPVQFALGRQWLLMGDSEGATLIEHVIARDLNALVGGADLLRRHYAQRSEQTLTERWQRSYELGGAALAERQGFQVTHQVLPHALPDHVLAKLIRGLWAVPHLQRAYLVRKRVQHFPQHPVFVLGFKSAGSLKRYDRARAAAVAQAIRDRNLPFKMIIVNIEGADSRFAPKFRSVVGARIV